MLLELGAILVGLAILARLAGRLGLTAIPFYLAAGLAFGDGGILPLVTTEGFVRIGAEIGLVLLLFMLGLEYPARELIDTLRASRRIGVLDVVLNMAPGFLAGLLLGWGLVPAMFLGGATYVSSSGLVARLLGDLGLGPGAAKMVLAILVLEDLAMAVFLPVLGSFVATEGALGGIVTAAIAIGLVLGLLALAMRVEVGVSRLLFSRSDEALLLSILGFGVLVAGVAEQLEVSAAIGALLAGIMVSGPGAEKMAPLLAPLRDLFAAIFFAFIGLSVDPASLPPVLLAAALLAVATAATKYGTGWLAGAQVRLEPGERAIAGAALIARGEFSLAIAGLAVAAQVEPSPAPLIVGYVLIMAVAGPLIAKVVHTRVAR